ncbi:Os10g0122200 [Oryza sativa Japonica Group]|uniref:Os10g0122200 protein n=1 Tax=Oryza sativa subsp. japonica TaxID=39947 RepID=A0A0N7KRD3_ORYSJ|nr:Os10g0122200 [Oryza sativa Japonica Group]
MCRSERSYFTEKCVGMVRRDTAGQHPGSFLFLPLPWQTHHAHRPHPALLVRRHHPRRPPAAVVHRLEPDIPPARHQQHALVPTQLLLAQLADHVPLLQPLRYLLLGAPYRPHRLRHVAARHRAAPRHRHVHGGAVAVVPVLDADVLARVHRDGEHGGGVGVGHHHAGAAPPQRRRHRLEHRARRGTSDAVDRPRRDGDAVQGEPRRRLDAEHEPLGRHDRGRGHRLRPPVPPHRRNGRRR